jgi:hypothetical protein
MDLLQDDEEEPKKKIKPERVAIATYLSKEDAAKLAMIRARMGDKPVAHVLRRLIRFGYDQITKGGAS